VIHFAPIGLMITKSSTSVNTYPLPIVWKDVTTWVFSL